MKQHRNKYKESTLLSDEAAPRATARLSALSLENVGARKPLTKISRFYRLLVFGYLTIATVWVIFSELAFDAWIADPKQHVLVHIGKGLGFIVLTTAAFFLLFRRHTRLIRQIEEKLLARDKHVGSIIDTMANGVALIDLDGTIVDANPALAAILGLPQDEIIGRALAPAQNNRSKRITPAASILGFARQNGQWSGELVRRHRDGQLVPIHLTVAPLFDFQQKLIGFVADYVDLREIRTVEAHLDGLGAVIEQLATETNLQLLGEKALNAAAGLTQSQVGAVILADEKDGRLRHRWRFNLPEDTKNQWDLSASLVSSIIQDEAPQIIEDLQETPRQLPCFAAQGVHHALAVPITARGATRGALVVGTTQEHHQFNDRILPLMEALARQIAVAIHRHELLEEARESEARLRDVINTVPDILYTSAAPRFETRFISPSVEQILGASADEFLHDPLLWQKLILKEDRAELSAALAESLETQERYAVEYRMWDFAKTQTRWFEDRGRIERDQQGQPLTITGVVSDITARKQAEERLAFLAFHDPLTELPNRLGLIERLDRWIEQREAPQGILLFCDLDRFHLINDIHGHASGDALLVETARRLKTLLPKDALLSRIGADEFVAFIPIEPSDAENTEPHLPEAQAQRFATKIMESFQSPFTIQEQRSYLSATIGIALLDPASDSAASLLKKAHRALAYSKELGPSNFAFYEGELARRQQRRLSLQSQIHHGLEHNEFQLFYQPLVDLETGDITGAEALLRWTTGDGERISPAEFIPVAEESGLIIPLGDWVLRRACQDLRRWKEQGIFLKISLNLSPRQFFHDEIVEKILFAVQEAQVSPESLELELTESAMLVDPEQTAQILARLQKAGFSIAIDDFGTGYSSLERLKQLPVQTLKIDRSFIADLPGDARDASIVRSAITLSKNFSMASLAEGIETHAQWQYLRQMGCQYGQGFFFSPPLPADKFQSLCTEPLTWVRTPVLSQG